MNLGGMHFCDVIKPFIKHYYYYVQELTQNDICRASTFIVVLRQKSMRSVVTFDFKNAI